MTTIIPAPAGFYQLSAYLDDAEGPIYNKLPVVAWEVEGGTAWPVVLFDGANEGVTAIQFPDGTVFEDYMMTSDEWRESVSQRWSERQPTPTAA